jgi:hypothetical protein
MCSASAACGIWKSSPSPARRGPAWTAGSGWSATLLVTFNILYGRVPKANKSGKNFTPDKPSKMFQHRRLEGVLRAYAE